MAAGRECATIEKAAGGKTGANERNVIPLSKQSLNPGTLLAPLPPALVSCGTMERSNILTIAWTGIVNTIPPMTYISIRPERYSYGIIKESGEFVINLTTRRLARAADFCGARTGARMDKFTQLKLTKEPVSRLSCPAVGESPLNLECRVKQILPLGSHELFLAEIVAVNVDGSLLDEHGKLRLERAHPVAFAHGAYYELGQKLGTFGYSVRKKKPQPKKQAKPM